MIQEETRTNKSWLSREWFIHCCFFLVYSLIASFFLYGVITSAGNVAQGDWTVPLSANGALDSLYQHFFIWHYFGFGGVVTYFDLLFSIPNALFAQIGLFGGTEIKFLAVGLVALGGWLAYLMCRSFGISRFSSFLSGLFFMTTAVVFDYLMIGWTINIIAYDVLPLFILMTKKALETGATRFSLASGLVLAIALMYPQAIIFYAPILVMIVVFVAGTNIKKLAKGVLHSLITLSIGALSYAYFFTSYTSVFYSFDTNQVSATNSHLILVNVARFWGSTYNYQFETYFPQNLLLFSFIPLTVAFLALVLRPRNKWLYFFSLLYIFSLVPVLAGNAVFSLPFGFAFRILSLFLIPSALGIATLIAFSSDAIIARLSNLRNIRIKKYANKFVAVGLLVIVLLSGVPWWTGQTSGAVISSPATKLNLYELPSGYSDWVKQVPSNDTGMFVLYWPIALNLQFENTTYFSQIYQGVNNPFYQPSTNLPLVFGDDKFYASMSSFFSGNFSQLGEIWGSMSIKYMVVLTDTFSATARANDIISGLYNVTGVVEFSRLPGVIVFENKYAKPVIYSNNSDTQIDIISRNPAYYKVSANSSSPFTLNLNQEYKEGWTASINGEPVSSSDHFQSNGSFNAWQINSTGQIIIEIYYQPQTNYLAGVLVSLVTFYGVSAYLIVITTKGLIVRRKIKMNFEEPSATDVGEKS